MSFKFNVDTDEVIKFTNKLEKLSKSAFPVAVRQTLNSLAFDVKKNTMPHESERTFINREKNFFKSNSTVETAKGFELRSMQSSIGFSPRGNRKSTQAVDDLEQQEHGGKIGSRSFIPHDLSRTSKNHRKNVSAKNRLGKIKHIVKVADAKGSNEVQKMIKSVIFAGEGGFVLNKNTLFRVDVSKRATNKFWRFKLTPVYSFKKGRSVQVKANHFMENATIETTKKANQFYIENAEKQFEKALR